MKRRLLIGIPLGLVALVAAAAGVAYWQASSALDQLHAGAKGPVVRAVRPELHRAPTHPVVKLPPEPSAQTILLVGSDHRWRSGDGARSDTVMLVRIQPDRHRIALLSIPRDLYVAIPGHGHDRINMAFHDCGERLLTRVVRDTLGVEIDHFVEIDFRGFKNIVDDVGGVWFPVDQRYFNRNVGTADTNYSNIDLQAGYQRLNGDQALAFARYRHDDSDFVRAARQQLLLRVVAHDAMGSTWDLFRVRRLAFSLAEATTSDISSLGEVLSLARAIHETPPSHVARLTVAASDFTEYGADYVRSSPEQLRATIRSWEGIAAPSKPRSATSRRAAKASPPSPSLTPDGGRGRALLESVANGIRTCAPRGLPAGFFWPSSAARSYVIARHPATALYATGGSGDSILLMYTAWADPPILDGPTTTVRRGGRTFDVYTAAGRIHQIAWHIGGTRAWLTNTLRDSLSNAQMIELAASCR